jgi:hypothetical protein
MGLTLNALVERNEAANHNLKALGLGRRLRNAGKATILDTTTFLTVTLPVAMFDTDYFVTASIADDGNLAVSMASGQKLVVEVLTATTFKLKLISAIGAALAADDDIDVMWSVSGGRAL